MSCPGVISQDIVQSVGILPSRDGEEFCFYTDLHFYVINVALLSSTGAHFVIRGLWLPLSGFELPCSVEGCVTLPGCLC